MVQVDLTVPAPSLRLQPSRCRPGPAGTGSHGHRDGTVTHGTFVQFKFRALAVSWNFCGFSHKNALTDVLVLEHAMALHGGVEVGVDRVDSEEAP